MELAYFRGVGAAAGILGLSTFEWAKAALGLRTASLLHLAFEAAAVLVAAVSFEDSLSVHLFMAMVVLSRVGLYGFDVGFMELQQRQVSSVQGARTSINSVKQCGKKNGPDCAFRNVVALSVGEKKNCPTLTSRPRLPTGRTGRGKGPQRHRRGR